MPDFDNHTTEDAGTTAPLLMKSIVPATLKQLTTAVRGSEANDILLDGKKLHRTRIIAQIMGVTRQANAVSLELDDGTGRLDARYWLSPDAEDDPNAEELQEVEKWQEGVYVRVFGHLRQNKANDKNNFVALSVTPIRDFNEVTLHFLEATYVHLKALKGDPMDVSRPVPVNNAQPAQSNVDLQPLYATVLEVIQRASTSPQGASIAYISEQMSPYGVNEPQVREAIQYLSSEGHVYPTFDEEHFKA